MRHFAWLDTRARFVAKTPVGGALLDLGTSNGETLSHIAELRPDLRLFAVDKGSVPQKCPQGCEFRQVDLEKEKLPWPDGSMDAMTCMHLVEHLNDFSLFLAEIARVLRPGGRIYFETPHPKSLILSSSLSTEIPLNFFDDLTHVRIVTAGLKAGSQWHLSQLALCGNVAASPIFPTKPQETYRAPPLARMVSLPDSRTPG